MADWYVSSVAYTAVAVWTNRTYSIGDLIRQTAPTAGNERVFRCTTAGASSSEPTWTLTKGSTTASTVAVFTEATGVSTWMGTQGSTATWLAPAARLDRALLWSATASDRVFVSSDHAETLGAAITLPSSAGEVPSIIICTSRTSTNFPPTGADVTTGATVTTTGAFGISFQGSATVNASQWYQGIQFNCSTGATGANISINSDAVTRTTVFKDCSLRLVGTGAGNQIAFNATQSPRSLCILDNTTVSFGATGQGITGNSTGLLQWQNTANAIVGATLPTTIFQRGHVYAKGVDLSALASGKTLCDTSSFVGNTNPTYLLENCKLGASVTIVSATPGHPVGNHAYLVNCDSGDTGYRSEYYRHNGTVSTETTITRYGGATNGLQKISHKFVSTSVAGFDTPLLGPDMYLWNSTLSSLTATVEIVSSGTLNDNEVWLEIEYLGTSGFPLGLIANDRILTPITTAAAQAASTAPWDSSPATPVTQKLDVTITFQEVGLVRATVCLAKASATLYVDPVVTLR